MEGDSRHELSYDLNTSNSREGGSFKGKQPHQPAVVTHPFVVCQPPIKLSLCLLQPFHVSRPLLLIGCWPHLFGLVIGPQRPTGSRVRLSSDQVCSHHHSLVQTVAPPGIVGKTWRVFQRGLHHGWLVLYLGRQPTDPVDICLTFLVFVLLFLKFPALLHIESSHLPSLSGFFCCSFFYRFPPHCFPLILPPTLILFYSRHTV